MYPSFKHSKIYLLLLKLLTFKPNTNLLTISIFKVLQYGASYMLTIITTRRGPSESGLLDRQTFSTTPVDYTACHSHIYRKHATASISRRIMYSLLSTIGYNTCVHYYLGT